MARYVTPVREAGERRRIFTAAHMHGGFQHAHPHLHDDEDKEPCGAFMDAAPEHSDHTHCRYCGSDDRLCDHKSNKKSGM